MGKMGALEEHILRDDNLSLPQKIAQRDVRAAIQALKGKHRFLRGTQRTAYDGEINYILHKLKD